MAWIDFLICLFFGWLGIHKFKEKKIVIGILYLCTLGLLGIGWIYDCICYLRVAIKHQSKKSTNSFSNKTDTSITNGEVIPKHTASFVQRIKNALLWCITVFFIFFSVVFFPSFSSILFFLIAALFIPILSWQSILRKYLNKKAKIIISIVLFLTAIVAVPTAQSSKNASMSNESSVLASEATTAVTEETISLSAEIVTATATEPTIELAIETPTESTVEVVTEPAIETTKNVSSNSSIASSSSSTIENVSSTEPTPAATEELTVAEASTVPIAEAPPEVSEAATTPPAESISNNNSSSSTDSSVAGDPDGDDSNGQVVYRTPYGSRYHLDPDCGGENSYLVTIDAAIQANLTPCQKCAQ